MKQPAQSSTEGVTNVTDPKSPAGCSNRQKASETWQDTHKHWYLLGGDTQQQSAQTPNAAGSATNTRIRCIYTHMNVVSSTHNPTTPPITCDNLTHSLK